MERAFLVRYLMSVDCDPEDSEPGVSQIWRNAINGLQTLIPYDEKLSVTCYCKVFYQLQVDPPKEHGFDSDYAIYISFLDK